MKDDLRTKIRLKHFLKSILETFIIMLIIAVSASISLKFLGNLSFTKGKVEGTRVPASATDSTSTLASALEGKKDYTYIDLACPTDGKEFATTSSKVRLKGNWECIQKDGEVIKESNLTNLTNKTETAIFRKANLIFTSDSIKLAKGTNSIVLSYTLASGKGSKIKLKIISKQ